MERGVAESLNDNLQSVYELTKWISINKKNLMDLYITMQYELYEVEEDVQDEFNQILKQEAMSFLSSLKKLESLLDDGTFQFDTDVDSIPVRNARDFLKISDSLSILSENLGGEFIVEIEEDLYEMEYSIKKKMNDDSFDENKAIQTHLDKIEKLNSTKEYINLLVEAIIDLTSEIEVMLEADDQEDEEEYE